MTREETIDILMVIQAAYPNYKPPDKTITVDLWWRMLRDYPYQQVEAAVDTYIRTDKSSFAPSVGAVIDKMQMVFGSDELNEIAAWNLVWKAVGSSGDYERAEKNFKKFPSVIQKTIRSPGQLREWALTQNINVEVVSSNFMRAYRTEAARERELKKLSPDLLALTKHLDNQITLKTNNAFKELTVGEQREAAMKAATPMPERVKKRKEELFRERTEQLKM